ncbi:hypothetical protein [Streptomyces sp. NBC_00576]|uniref:hypothetical protein n=1 Tax=Streptomyces sp. NBC_00576 TaxID=2903665 RepID=UPI002E822765|nr:hypothetical protein [Streptomyces sp. NBC_00576]WUB68896.1 hypothetical protein OG734_01660 [Streptomyces sp. NBC_00576]
MTGEAEQPRRALYQALQLGDLCGARRLQRSLPHRSSEEAPACTTVLPQDPLSAAQRRAHPLTRVHRKLNVTSRTDAPCQFRTLAVGSA